MQAIIYTQQDCPLCDQAKAHFGEGNYEERESSDLVSGKDRNMDAMAQLAIQNMRLPLIFSDGEWIQLS